MSDALSDFTQLSQAFGNMANSLIGLMNVKMETEVNRRQAEIGKIQTDFLMRLALPPGSPGRINTENFQAEFQGLNDQVSGYIDSVSDSMVKGRVQNILSTNSNAFKLKVAETWGAALTQESQANYQVELKTLMGTTATSQLRSVMRSAIDRGKSMGMYEPSKMTELENATMLEVGIRERLDEITKQDSKRWDDAMSEMSLSNKDPAKAGEIEATRARLDAVMGQSEKELADNVKAQELAFQSDSAYAEEMIESIANNKKISKNAAEEQIGIVYENAGIGVAKRTKSAIYSIGQGYARDKKPIGSIAAARAILKGMIDGNYGDSKAVQREMVELANEIDSWVENESEGEKTITKDAAQEWIDLREKYRRKEISAGAIYDIVANKFNIAYGADVSEKYMKLVRGFDFMPDELKDYWIGSDKRAYIEKRIAEIKDGKGRYKDLLSGADRGRWSDILKVPGQAGEVANQLIMNLEKFAKAGFIKNVAEIDEMLDKTLIGLAKSSAYIYQNLKAGAFSGAEEDYNKLLAHWEGGVGDSFLWGQDIHGQEYGFSVFSEASKKGASIVATSVASIINAGTLPPEAQTSFDKGPLPAEDMRGNFNPDEAMVSADKKFRIDANSSSEGLKFALSENVGTKDEPIWKPVKGDVKRVPDEKIVEYKTGGRDSITMYKVWNPNKNEWIHTAGKDEMERLRERFGWSKSATKEQSGSRSFIPVAGAGSRLEAMQPTRPKE